jgi:hypothetical protein
MRTLAIDFHAPAAASRSRWIGWCALALVVLALAALARHADSQQQALDAAAQRAEGLAARLHPAPVRGKEADDPALARRLAAANAVIDQLAVPWDALFRGLESADARGLGVLAVSPDPRERTLRVSGEARSVPEVLAYVERLSVVPMLTQVHLTHYETMQREGATLVAFTVGAAWQAR